MKGVATLYRWSVSADRQGQFVAQWRSTARELRRLGASGCHLLRAESGEYVGLIRWPSGYARSRAEKGPANQRLPGVRGLAQAELSIEDDVGSDILARLGSRRVR